MEKDMVITRILNAPRELVFKAWTDPDLLSQWWGPEHFTAPIVKIDPRVGGQVLLSMQSPEGDMYWSGGEFKEYDPPNRLAWTDHFADEDGNLVLPEAYGMPADFPAETLVTVTFETVDGNKTRLTIHNNIPMALAETAQAAEGWKSSLDKLATVVEPTGETA